MYRLEIKYTPEKGIDFRIFQDEENISIPSDSKMMGYMNQGNNFDLQKQDKETFIKALAFDFDGAEHVQIKAFMNEEDFLWLWDAMKYDTHRQFMLSERKTPESVPENSTEEEPEKNNHPIQEMIPELKKQHQETYQLLGKYGMLNRPGIKNMYQQIDSMLAETTCDLKELKSAVKILRSRTEVFIASQIREKQNQISNQIWEICEPMKIPENRPLSMEIKAQLNLSNISVARIADKARILTYNNTPFNIRKNVPYGKDNVKFYSKNICDIVQHLIAESFFLDASRNRMKLLKQKYRDYVGILQKKFGKNIEPQVQFLALVLPDISSDMEYIFIKNINKKDSSNLHKGFMSWDIYHFIEKHVPYVMIYCEQNYIHSCNAMLEQIATAFSVQIGQEVNVTLEEALQQISDSCTKELEMIKKLSGAATVAANPSVPSNLEPDNLPPKVSVSSSIDPKITEALQVIVKRSGKDAFKKGGKANAILADLLPQESYAKYRRRIRNAIDSGVCDFLIDSNLEQEILIKEAVRKLIHHTDMADEIAKETINILIEILI